MVCNYCYINSIIIRMLNQPTVNNEISLVPRPNQYQLLFSDVSNRPGNEAVNRDMLMFFNDITQ